MGRKVLLAAMSIFLIFQSYSLVIKLHDFDSTSWLVIIFIAWLTNMFITGVFAFLVFGFSAEKLLPLSYYKIYNAKKLKRFYRIMNVKVFRSFLLATFWRSKTKRQKYFNGKKDGIENFKLQSMKSEFGHVLPFIIINFIVTYVFILGKIKLGIATLLWNIVGNLYPIILQRYHRMRIQRLGRIQQQRIKNNS